MRPLPPPSTNERLESAAKRIAQLERELEEVKRSDSDCRQIITTYVEEIAGLESHLTAHKTALVKAREALKQTQWGFNFRRCPVCAGWNCSPNGETDMKHTKVCPVDEALTAINEVMEEKK